MPLYISMTSRDGSNEGKVLTQNYYNRIPKEVKMSCELQIDIGSSP